MDIQILRRETAADHLAVEGAMPLMHPTLTQAEYITCLQRLHGIVSAFESHAANLAPAWLQPTLITRRRTPLLEADLAHFHAAIPTQADPGLPTMHSLSALLGTMYVMEGSTLGGQFIARHVATTLHLPEGHGNTFFAGHGPQTGAMWREFCDILKTHIPDSETEAAVTAAKAMFQTFGAWMQQEIPANV